MQLINLIAIVATLAIGSNAAAMRRDGARLAQFRVFGAKGCSALNDGFYTVDQSDAGSCKQFTSPPSVASLNLEQLKLPAADGCTGASSSRPLFQFSFFPTRFTLANTTDMNR